jgi:ABC-type sugar transport system ATPase subunit
MNSVEILKMTGITKKFPGVMALQDVNFILHKGEVHALLGENGAGKSTLMKVLGGIHKPNAGQIFLEGKEVEIKNVDDSQNLGVSIIHQELVLVSGMTVAQNIFLGKEKSYNHVFYLNDKEMNIKAQKLLDRLGVDINAKDYISDLSVAQQQMVEIAKALSFESKIVVMDEPTATLTDKEVNKLFELIKSLKKQKISIIYISHRMEELFAISDKVSVMRDGQYIGTEKTKETTKSKLVEMMVGRKIEKFFVKSEHEKFEKILEVKDLNRKGVLNNINFDLFKGEILGVSGIVGAGRTELMRALFGIDKIDSGEIILNDKKVTISSPRDAMKIGIAMVPESRKDQGLFLQSDVGYNITIQILQKLIKFIFKNKKEENKIITDFEKKLQIKSYGPSQIVNTLSGGNQQKVVIAKWLATNPKVLILDEPTRGVDVAAKAEIYELMSKLVKNGMSIIMVSSELPEIVNLSDRVIVMYGGEITAKLEKEEISQEKIMHYATGSKEKICV